MLVVPVWHRLAGRASVTLADVEHEPLVGSPDDDWNAFWCIDPDPVGAPPQPRRFSTPASTRSS